MIDGLLLLFAMQIIGELLHQYAHIPLPGSVIGLLLLFSALLIFKNKLSASVAPAANALLKHLTLIYFPVGVGLILNWSAFEQYGWALLLSVVLSTLLCIPILVWLSQWLLRNK